MICLNNPAFACYSIGVENKCLQDTWRRGGDCLVSRAHFWLRTERPWHTKTSGLIMWVHRKVSQHCCANRVSGHRPEAGQMLGKGQWGYVILIREGFGGFGNLVSYLGVTLRREKLWLAWIFFPSFTCCLCLTALFTNSSLASTNLTGNISFQIFNRIHITQWVWGEYLNVSFLWIHPASSG